MEWLIAGFWARIGVALGELAMFAIVLACIVVGVVGVAVLMTVFERKPR